MILTGRKRKYGQDRNKEIWTGEAEEREEKLNMMGNNKMRKWVNYGSSYSCRK
jgi:hypothetical protein